MAARLPDGRPPEAHSAHPDCVPEEEGPGGAGGRPARRQRQQLLLPAPGTYRLVWTNAQGQVVRQQQADATGQQPAISWQRQQLQPGLYLLQATHLASRQQYQLQVVVQ